MAKKDASLEALFLESEASTNSKKDKAISPTLKGDKKNGRGRPKKIHGARQQFPLYLPEEVYFECLDWVNLRKRSDRQFSMNDLMIEALDVWLKKNGRPSVDELIEKGK